MTYCEALKTGDFFAVKQCFDQSDRLEEEGFKKPIWTECRIVESYKTKLAGKRFEEGLVVQSGDVEVVKEVKMIHPEKGNPKTRFWYLLRDFDGKWRIISHSHIPDKNYPPID